MSATRSFFGLLKNNKTLLVMSVAAMIFLMVLMDVLGDDIAHLDSSAYVFFVLHLRRTWLTPIMQSFSGIASPVVLAVMLLVVEAFAPGRRPGFCAGINLVLSVAICLILKEVVQRERPAESIRLVSETGYSFPSGHSMVAMAFFGFLLWMVLHYEKDRIVKVFCTLGFAAVILLIGLSRVYLGVHYASDVLAGFCVTVVWLGIFTRTLAPLLLEERTKAAVEGGDGAWVLPTAKHAAAPRDDVAAQAASPSDAMGAGISADAAGAAAEAADAAGAAAEAADAAAATADESQGPVGQASAVTPASEDAATAAGDTEGESADAATDEMGERAAAPR